MQIEINKLKENPKNIIYTNLNDEDFDELKKSISIKLQNPIIINKNNIILSGHRRYKAAKELGWSKIDYIIKTFESEEDELFFFLTENKYRVKTTTELFEEAKIYKEIEVIKAKKRQGTRTDIRATLPQGQDADKNDPTATLPEGQEEEKTESNEEKGKASEKAAKKAGLKETNFKKLEKIDENKKKIKDKKLIDFITFIADDKGKGGVDTALRISKLSNDLIRKIKDKFYSGIKYKSTSAIIKEVEKEKHFGERKVDIPSNIKIYNDDCRNILKDIPDNSIDCLLTDPPYAIDFVSSWKASNKEEFNDSKDDILPLLNDVCKLLQQKCKKDAHLYFFSSWMSYTYFEDIISKYFDISNVIIWEKNNTSLVDFDKRYAFSYEQIIFCKQKGNNDRMLKNKSSRDVVHFDRIANPDHTCEKPVDLLEYFIDNSTVENELVVDCFAGTFNSMVAARNLKRSYIGIELKNEFFKKGEKK